MSENTIPRHALPPEPLTRFLNEPFRRETLRAILRDPVFIAAMNFLQEQDRIRPEQLDTLPDIAILRKASFHAGVASVYERLQELTKAITPREEVEGWDHIKPIEP